MHDEMGDATRIEISEDIFNVNAAISFLFITIVCCLCGLHTSQLIFNCDLQSHQRCAVFIIQAQNKRYIWCMYDLVWSTIKYKNLHIYVT